jgi:hypothetical protein
VTFRVERREGIGGEVDRVKKHKYILATALLS